KKEGWPRDPRRLAEKLKTIAPNLRAEGLDVRFGNRTKKGRLISIIKDGKSPAPASPPTPDFENQQLNRVTVGDGERVFEIHRHPHRHQLSACDIRIGDDGVGGDGEILPFTNSRVYEDAEVL
ncbi:MAG TPA: hypothetical protein VEF04_22530, partial [Blastocatellia bacterium]|nr:hypothetical protein [Blastocatellia bacterium]